MFNISMILTIIFGLTVVTNILTEVIKKITWDKIPTNLVVVVIAETLTIAVGAAYAQINGINVLWYHAVGVVVVGVFVAYAAMFGFDKLKQALEQIITIKSEKSKWGGGHRI